MGKIKKLVSKIIKPNRIDYSKFENISYAQEGEDLLLKRIFSTQKNGFYVDIGAHHPIRFSNTYLFYLEGWKGINIDPLPGTKKLFEQLRPNDITLEFGISASEQEITYYMFNEPALNTFDKNEATKKDGIQNGRYFIENEIKVKTYPLKDILDKFLPPNQTIDFLTIDVEGLDFQVLQSNDWNKYRPMYILVEELYSTIESTIKNSSIHNLCKSIGYEYVYRTFNTSIYKKVD